MLTLVLGGSGSGKSAFAEGLIQQTGLTRRLYVATMEVWDDEGRARVARHRAMRSGKGFETLECPRDLEIRTPPAGGAALLEDLPNLVMNEFFAPGAEAGPVRDKVLAGVRRFAANNYLVAVSGDLFTDGLVYPAQTRAFLELLAGLHRTLAREAEAVYEVVCGIPIPHKGGQTP